jgi:hypothetical protein
MTHEVVTSGVVVPFNGLDFQTARAAALAAHPEMETALKTKTQAAMEKLAAKGKTKTTLGIKDVEEGRHDIFKINFLLLEVEQGWNSRDLTNPDNIEHIEWLSRNIPENGQIDPIEVRNVGGRYIIRDGHCRYFGMALAISRGWKCESVKVVTVAQGKNDLDDILQQQLRNSGKRLSPIEAAVNLQKALATGASIELIGKKLSKDVQVLKAQLRLLEANHATQQQVHQGTVAATLVSEAVRDHGPAEAAKLVDAAIEDAKAGGKTKATKVNFLRVQGRVSPKKALGEIRNAIRNFEAGEAPADAETVSVPREIWDSLVAAAKSAE